MLNIAKEAVGGSKNASARAREALEGLRKIDQLVPAKGGYKLARNLGF